MHMLAHLTHAKLKKQLSACTVAREFGMHTRANKYWQHTRYAGHKLGIGFATLHMWHNYRYIAVGNEIQLCCM